MCCDRVILNNFFITLFNVLLLKSSDLAGINNNPILKNILNIKKNFFIWQLFLNSCMLNLLLNKLKN